MNNSINTGKRFLYSLTKKPYATNLTELDYLSYHDLNALYSRLKRMETKD